MSSLWNHKKKCTVVQSDEEPVTEELVGNGNLILEILKQNNDFKTMILEKQKQSQSFTNEALSTTDNKDLLMMELIKQNQEFKELMLEQNKTMMEMASKNSNSNTTNNNNNIKNQNNFNINMFLNEKCKDAISLEDFVESLQIDSQTAEYVGKHGFVNGITHIFMTGLKQLDVHMRPFHCTDLKRETMYVKGVDMWAKDGEHNNTMMSAIKDVSTKNMKQLPVWIEENPDSKISGTDKYEEQIDIMKGMLDTNLNKEKVLKNLAKEAMIDKTQ